MKSYQDLVNEIKEEMKNGGRRTFSKETFLELSKAYLNDVGNITHMIKTKNDGIEEIEVNVVDDYRKMIEKILVDFGVDKQEASKIRTNDYQFTNVDALYPLCSELIYNYIDTGKKFTMLPKRDCTASFTLNEFEEEIKMNKAPGSDAEPKPTKYGRHKKIKVESNCPGWLKETIK